MRYSRPEKWTREIHRATNRVSLPWQNLTGRARWNLVAPIKRDRYYIGIAHTRIPYGRTVNQHGYLTHMLYGILTVWKGGEFLGSMALWKCGARCPEYVLLEEPNSPVCPACTIQRPGRDWSGN